MFFDGMEVVYLANTTYDVVQGKMIRGIVPVENSAVIKANGPRGMHAVGSTYATATGINRLVESVVYGAYTTVTVTGKVLLYVGIEGVEM